mgnify:CR=1 FL=1
MTTAEAYRKNIAKMCAEMSESQLQRVPARVQHRGAKSASPIIPQFWAFFEIFEYISCIHFKNFITAPILYKK